MLNYDQIIEAIHNRIRGLSDRQFHPEKICTELSRFSDFDVAHIFEELYLGAIQKRKGYILILEALTNFDVVKKHFSQRLSQIYDIADEEGLMLATEWLSPLPLVSKISGNLFVHDDLQHLTLGERKYLAKKADPQNLERLLVDPNPMVMANLLNHSKLEERHVVQICARQPNHPEIMQLVYNHSRWFARYKVKLALLNNPATDPRLVMLLLVWLSVQDLRDLFKSKRFSPGFIKMILKERKRGNHDTSENDDNDDDDNDDDENDDDNNDDNNGNQNILH